ncbi:protein-glutamate O-methyltransferase CheR [Candidatus Woesearchaeota archaeon]|nr:protein-glutamate O-methyltransferase CheR [Candidatus Woesearchaeota archaeon]
MIEFDNYEIFITELDKLANYDFKTYTDSFIKRRIQARMTRLNMRKLSDYLHYLRSNPEEIDRLHHDFSIHVTHFFRDKSMYDVFMLESLFHLLNEKDKLGDRKIKLWSAGCSSGEETYTIAIILLELLGNRIQDFNVEIVGSDIDKAAIDFAKIGKYESSQFKETEKDILDKYFQKTGEDYLVIDEVKKLVSFKVLDLLSAFKPRNLDVIFCRNVVIYFSQQVKETLFSDFYNCLNKEGLLILGKTETLIGPSKDKFKMLNIAERIYKKE